MSKKLHNVELFGLMAARLLLGQKVLDDFLNFGGNFDIFVEKIRF